MKNKKNVVFVCLLVFLLGVGFVGCNFQPVVRMSLSLPSWTYGTWRNDSYDTYRYVFSANDIKDNTWSSWSGNAGIDLISQSSTSNTYTLEYRYRGTKATLTLTKGSYANEILINGITYKTPETLTLSLPDWTYGTWNNSLQSPNRYTFAASEIYDNVWSYWSSNARIEFVSQTSTGNSYTLTYRYDGIKETLTLGKSGTSGEIRINNHLYYIL